MPHPADSLMREAFACPCGRGLTPLCAKCECLTALASAAVAWEYTRLTGEPWEVVMERRDAGYTVLRRTRIGGLRGLGYTLTGWACEAYALAFYWGWVLPRTAWLHWTGRIPKP